MPTLILHTFVICAYKESPYLEVAIRSALAQESVSADRSRVILYTSTPNAFIRGLCDKYGIAVFSGNGRGIGSDWNHAVACATTNYVTLVHQDDVYEKEYGAAVIAAFEEKKDATLVFSDYYEMDGSGERRPRNLNLKIKTAALRLMMLSKNKTYQRRIFAFGDFISCPAVSYNMTSLQDFKFDEEMKVSLDWEAWERIMRRPGNVYFLPRKLMGHRIHAGSETTNMIQDATRDSEDFIMFRKYWGVRMARFLTRLYSNSQKTNQ